MALNLPKKNWRSSSSKLIRFACTSGRRHGWDLIDLGSCVRRRVQAISLLASAEIRGEGSQR